MRRMSKTQTNHEPSPDELAHGADDHGLHHPGDLADEAHGPDDHGEGHGHDDHAHDSEALGPIDVQAWGALLVGVAAGLVIVFCLVLTTSILG
jgi:ABC-type nickel/cobalt efflux system permease component RcnA